MCSRVTCPACERPTFAGCGNHVEQVLGDIPPDDRCQCARGQGAGPSVSRRSWPAFGRRR